MTNIKIEIGSGNVFDDLGVAESAIHLAKAELASQIGVAIKNLRLTQIQVAQRLGVSQPDISRLLRGDFRQYSMERLMTLLTNLGRDVQIIVSKAKPKTTSKELHASA
jgi:predicted XRE-type DNA-binding protein